MQNKFNLKPKYVDFWNAQIYLTVKCKKVHKEVKLLKSRLIGHYLIKDRDVVDAYFKEGNVMQWQIVPDSSKKLMIFLEIKDSN